MILIYLTFKFNVTMYRIPNLLQMCRLFSTKHVQMQFRATLDKNLEAIRYISHHWSYYIKTCITRIRLNSTWVMFSYWDETINSLFKKDNSVTSIDLFFMHVSTLINNLHNRSCATVSFFLQGESLILQIPFISNR